MNDLPRLGDEFENWLIRQRETWSYKTVSWLAVDDALNTYRLHADTRTPLSEQVSEGGDE